MKLSNSPGGVNKRRIRALERLKEQLKRGVKTPKHEFHPSEELTQQDKKRIEKEINTLSGRIVSDESARATRRKVYRGA
jgi:hypothetical protein